MKPLLGFVICQNGLPDILRCLDSLVCCDSIYICDGGSTDGTREWLESVKDIYRLKIFNRKFDTMREQRNFLLAQLPKDVWVVNIDMDEALNPVMTYYLKEYTKNIGPEHYKTAHEEERVVVMDVPYLILKGDYEHYCYPYTFLRGKVFYYTDNIKFYHPYHSEPSYDEKRMSQYLGLSVPDQFAIFHYAFFNPRYMESRKERLEKLMENEKDNLVEGEYNGWFGERDVRPVPPQFLP
jgi:hypothetical protein